MLASEIRTLEQLRLLPSDSFYVTVNGRIVDWQDLDEKALFSVHFRLRGGKGGFGSLLRSFRIHRSTNQLMCRDLSGRRLADVKEEERIRQWIEKRAEREAEKRRKRREKYEKLKSGPPKHDFNDPEYIRVREKLLDETDDAFDAGVNVLSSKKCKDPHEVVKSLTSSSEDEGEDPAVPGPSKRGVKRKREVKIFKRKQFKMDDESGSSTSKESLKENIIPKDVVKDAPECDRVGAESSHQRVDLQGPISRDEMSDLKGETAAQPKPEKSARRDPVVFSDINLDEYNNTESLHCLGLDHLKYALEIRGLKCGGSLVERAARLFSVKGLKPDEYPKAIKAPPQKKQKK